MKATVIKYTFSEHDDLSTRALNVIESLGGNETAFEYFCLHGHFLGIPKIGTKTNEELIAYFEFKSESLVKNSPIKINEKLLGAISIVFSEYQKLKSRLTERTKFVLSSIESAYDILNNDENKARFIQDFTENKIDFKNVKSIGVIANRKIKETAVSLAEYINNLDITSYEETSAISLKKTIAKLFKTKNVNGIEVFINENEAYFLNRIAAVMAMSNFSTDVRSCVLQHLMFSAVNKSLTEIAQECNCTRENVRIYNKALLKKIIPNIVKTIINRLHDYQLADYPNLTGNILLYTVETSVSFEYNHKFYDLNSLFLKAISKNVFKKTYFNFDELLQTQAKKSKIFVAPNNIWLLHKDFVEKNKFAQLLLFLEEEIYNFETVGFEYDLNTLIRRFYKEQNIIIENEQLHQLSDLIAEAKQKQVHLDVKKIKQQEKTALIMAIHEAVIILMENQEKAIKTPELLTTLSANFPGLELNALLKLLNRSPEFRKVGADTWILSAKLNDISLTGNITDIVQKLLEVNVEPLHVSDFLNRLSKLREINERSLITNLKTSKKFQFFNCGYIGLNSKKYNLYWSSLPRINGRAFTSPSIKRIQLKYNGDLIKGFREEYGYPEKATLHLLSKSDHVDDL